MKPFLPYFRRNGITMHDLLDIYNAQNRFGDLLDMSFEVIEPGKIKYEMLVQEQHIALNNMAHGGSIAGMMDGVLGIAALSAVAPEGKFVATVEFKIDFINAAPLGSQLMGIGEVIKQGKRLLFVEGKITQGDQLIAKASGTFTAYPAEKILPELP